VSLTFWTWSSQMSTVRWTMVRGIQRRLPMYHRSSTIVQNRRQRSKRSAS
jgi:hypothetical protein